MEESLQPNHRNTFVLSQTNHKIKDWCPKVYVEATKAFNDDMKTSEINKVTD